jgi:hypothetical protein
MPNWEKLNKELDNALENMSNDDWQKWYTKRNNMKAKLIKTNVNYLLEDDKGVIIASTSTKEGNNKLSKQNCDEIFGVVDVEKLAEEFVNDLQVASETVNRAVKLGYEEGFNKAIELNKDKVFTIEDIRKAYQQGEEDSYLKGGLTKTKEDNYIQSIQQPTEIEVEIETETKVWEFISNGEFESFEIIPKLDANGCLILKKI